MKERVTDSAAEIALYALTVAWPTAKSEEGLYLFLPNCTQSLSYDDIVEKLSHLPKPVSCLAVPLLGRAAIGTWCSNTGNSERGRLQERISENVVAELESRGSSHHSRILVHDRDQSTDAGLVVKQSVFIEWIGQYDVLGLELSVGTHEAVRTKGELATSVQLAPASTVLVGNALWSRRNVRVQRSV